MGRLRQWEGGKTVVLLSIKEKKKLPPYSELGGRKGQGPTPPTKRGGEKKRAVIFPTVPQSGKGKIKALFFREDEGGKRERVGVRSLRLGRRGRCPRPLSIEKKKRKVSQGRPGLLGPLAEKGTRFACGGREKRTPSCCARGEKSSHSQYRVF